MGIKNATGEFDKPHQIRFARRSLAQVLTILRERNIKIAHLQLDKLNTAKDISEKLEEIYNLEPSASKKVELDEFIKTLNSTKQDIKILIPNLDYDKLQEVIVKVNELYNLYIEEAKVFNKEVAQIPIFQEQYYEEQINELYNSYADLDENLKSLITTKEKLDTLYNNLIFDNSNRSKLLDISKMCYVDEIIDNNLGFNMLIEENGFNLSGGEKRRVAIAGVISMKPKVLVLDEPINGLDADGMRIMREILVDITKKLRA